MATQEFTYSAAQILQPAFPDPLNKLCPAAFGPGLTIAKGQSVGRKTADGKMYPFASGNSDGTQIWAGFNQQALSTDSSGNVYFVFGGTAAGAAVQMPASNYAEIYTSGVFDPSDVSTKATPVAQVDTVTPAGTITTGDVYTLTLNGANGVATAVSFTVGATATAAAASAGLIAAWNANATTAAVATATGTATVILTAVVPGNTFSETPTVVGVGTVSKASTTAASGRAIADVLTGAPGARVLQPTGFWRIP